VILLRLGAGTGRSPLLCAGPHPSPAPEGSPSIWRMGFSGWSPEAVEFFEGLRADNTRTYWNAHKEFYEASVRGPVAELLDELSGGVRPGRIARPYRDFRFRADKSPYKTEIYATLDRGGYVRFGADGLSAALGYYMMTTTPAAAVPAGGKRRNGRRRAGRGDGAAAGRGAAGRRRADAHDRSARVSKRPSPHRTAPPQGPDLLAAMAARAVAGHGESQGPRGGLLAHRGPLHNWLDQHVGPDPT